MTSAEPRPRALRVLLISLLVLLGTFALLLRIAYNTSDRGEAVSLDQVYRYAANSEIISIKLLDEDAQLVGQRCVMSDEGPTEGEQARGGDASGAPECRGKVVAFRSSYPSSDVSTQDLIVRVAAGGAQVTVDKQTGKALTKIVASFLLPLFILANLFGIIFITKGGDSSMAAVVGFGRLGRQRERQRRIGTGVTFANVAGAGDTVAELREVIDYLADPRRFELYGAAPPKGVLLFGPPGCGKTLLARATAGETGVPFFSVAGTEFVESLVGVGAARVRDLFRQVREVAPAIVFIDEIDAVGRRRSGEGSSGGEREQTLNQLLVELDGFEVNSGIVLMGATNRPDILDPALLRPGRFDRHIVLEPPDVQGRREILALHTRTKPLAPGVDLDGLARRTPGFTGADLANLVNEGALLAIREGKNASIEQAHLDEAVLRVLHGPQRRGTLMSPEERRRIAVHEAGHTLVAKSLSKQGQYQRVSIVARGRGLGQSTVTDQSERVLLTATDMRARLAIAMAGRAAEVLMLGELSTTSQDDLETATELAREMVGRHGMSEGLGGLRLLGRGDGYPGASAPVVEAVSAATMQVFDQEVKGLLDAAGEAATEVLLRHQVDLEGLAVALDQRETLEGAALEALLSEVNAQPLPIFAGPGAHAARSGSAANGASSTDEPGKARVKAPGRREKP